MSQPTGGAPVPPPTTIQTSAASTSSQTTTLSSTNTPSVQPSDFDFYYYILIIVGLLLIVVVAYALNRRKRQQKALARRNRHSALSQDLDGYEPRRAWVHRAYWNRNDGMQMRREDGLDESGEAPPPYARRGNEVLSNHPVPLRAMTKPPDYQETYRAVAVDIGDHASRSGANAGLEQGERFGSAMPAEPAVGNDTEGCRTPEAPPAILR